MLTLDIYYRFNVAIKMVVQWSLFGGALLFLGTERHRKYIPDIETFKTGGCFAMTEIGHGSNVRGLETTAEYDPATKEFIIHSPTPTAGKFWIGNAAKHAHYAAVFARLILRGKDLGIHCFVVPIRDPATNDALPGVTLTYCGHKMGLNGVDNGNIQFYKVRIPRENMLNRFSDVTEDGKYESLFDSPAKNFGATMSALVSGRVRLASTLFLPCDPAMPLF
jgi:acyl-CoA oxidase